MSPEATKVQIEDAKQIVQIIDEYIDGQCEK